MTTIPWTDDVLEYTYKGTDYRCGVLLLSHEEGPMVILTKMGSDDSMYQTFVGAAKAVCDRYGLEEHDVIWIEHYKGNESRPSTFAEVWNVNTDIHFRGPDPGLNRRTIENPEAEALTAWISDTFMTSAPPFMK